MQPEGMKGAAQPVTTGPLWTRRDDQIEYTKTGLLLLLLAVLLQWIPIIQYLGLIVGAIGAVEMIRGAPAFRDRHNALVWASVLLFIVAETAAFGLVFGYAATVQGIGNASGPGAAATFLSAYDGLVEGSIVAASLVSLSFLLIAFDLENTAGKLMLAVAVLAQIVISVSLFSLVINPLIHESVTQAFATNPVNLAPIQAADVQINGLSALKLLNAIPAVIFAAGYLIAHGRLGRREIPSPIPPPPMTPPSVP